MSKPFHHICHHPHTNWQAWIHSVATRGEANNIAKAIWLIERAVGRIPRDLWNLIVRFAFEHPLRCEPSRWNHDLLYWLEYWVGHPAQHPHNALIAYDDLSPTIYDRVMFGGTREDDYLAGTREDDYLAGISKIAFEESSTPPHPKWYPRIGDIFLGIMVNDDDVAKIKSCNMLIGEASQPFVFLPQYQARIRCARDNSEHSYYYCPPLKVIPFVSMPYSSLTLQVVLTESGLDKPPQLRQVYLLCLGESRTRLIHDRQILNRDDPSNTFVCDGGALTKAVNEKKMK